MDGKLNWQQKVWKYGGVLLYAFRPFLLYVFLPPTLMAVMGPLLNRRGYAVTEAYYNQASNFYTFLGILLVLYLLWRSAKKRGVSLAEEVTVSFQGLNYRCLIGMALFGAAVAIAISAFYTLLPDALMGTYDRMSGAGYRAYDVMLMILSVTIVAPVAEEMIFRGYMLNRLMPEFGERFSVWFTAVLFALCHVSVFWGLYGLFMGYVLGRAAVRHDNILYSLAIHIGFNLPSVLNYFLTANERTNDLFFGSRFLILCYGLIAAAVSALLWRTYRKAEKL